LPRSNAAYDVYLTSGGTRKGFLLAKGEDGVKQYQVGLAPALAPQQRLSADNLYEGQPPEVNVVFAAEKWSAGAGFNDGQVDGCSCTRYNYSRGIDLSEEFRAYLSPFRNQTTDTNDAALDGAPVQFLTTSLGTFLITENRIYEWDTTVLKWESRDSSGSFQAGAIEHNSVVYVPRGTSNAYVYSSDGVTWTASTRSNDDKYADWFCNRGDDGDSTPTLNVIVRLRAGRISASTDGVNSGTAWSTEDTIGPTNETARSVFPFDNQLIIFKKEGIYAFDFTNVDDIWKSSYIKDDNAQSVFQWANGKFYANYGDRLIEYDPAATDGGLRYVYPAEDMDSPEVKGAITGISGTDDHIYLTIKNYNGNTYVMKGRPDEAWHTWAFPVGSEGTTELPASGTNETGVGAIAWTNPSNITVTNNSYATATTGTSNYLTGTQYGFDLPADAEIDGVVVNIPKFAQPGSSPGQLTPSYVNYTVATSPSSVSSLSVSNPDPGVGGRLHVLMVETTSSSAASIAGWNTALTQSEVSLDRRLTVFYKISDVTDASSFAVSFSLSSVATIFALTYTNVDTNDPFEAVTSTNFSTSGTSHTLSGVTTGVDNSMLLGVWFNSNQDPFQNYSSVSSPLTIRAQNNQGPAPALMFADGVQSSAGASGTKTATFPTSVLWAGAVLAFNSGPESPPDTDIVDNVVTLWVAGAAAGDNKASVDQWANTNTTSLYGSPSDTWGLALNPTIVNATNFGAAISAVVTEGTASVEAISITIYYKVPGGSRESQTVYVAGPGAILSENPVVLTGYGDNGAVYYILPRSNMRPQDDPNYLYEIDHGIEEAFVVGPWIDFGASAYEKFLNRGTVLADNTTAGKPITLWYDIEANGEAELVAAKSDGLTAQNIDGQVTLNRVRYIVYMDTTELSTSPYMLGLTLQATLNQPRYRMWNLVFDLSNNQSLYDGNQDYFQEVTEIEKFLFSATTQRPVFRDRLGIDYNVKINDIQGFGYIDERQGGEERDRPTMQVQLIEVSPVSDASNPARYGRDRYGEGKQYS
jgi:hypothetical protein